MQQCEELADMFRILEEYITGKDWFADKQLTQVWSYCATNTNIQRLVRRNGIWTLGAGDLRAGRVMAENVYGERFREHSPRLCEMTLLRKSTARTLSPISTASRRSSIPTGSRSPRSAS